MIMQGYIVIPICHGQESIEGDIPIYRVVPGKKEYFSSFKKKCVKQGVRIGTGYILYFTTPFEYIC